MTKYEQLLQSTRDERDYLYSAPIIRQTLAGGITLDLYIAFLTQAYHHVRHTVPLMMAAGARLDSHHHWLQKEIVHYLEEELGHDQWILNDIAVAGGDPDSVARSTPLVETDAMVAYAYDTVTRRHAVGFFGMVFVLEGTSAALALTAAEKIQACLGLPDRAFSYLRSHGRLDQEHVQHLAGILQRCDDTLDIPAITRCARAIYKLYGNVFRALENGAVGTDQQTESGRLACN